MGKKEKKKLCARGIMSQLEISYESFAQLPTPFPVGSLRTFLQICNVLDHNFCLSWGKCLLMVGKNMHTP